MSASRRLLVHLAISAERMDRWACDMEPDNRNWVVLTLTVFKSWHRILSGHTKDLTCK